MPCTKQHTKKYTSRNSPPYPANDCKVGSSKKGNDGSMYTVSSPNVNGVKRWLKKSANSKGTIKRRSDYDNVLVTFKPVYKKPAGTKWMFFVEDSSTVGSFRRPDDFGTSLVYGKNAKKYVKEGVKVWVVSDLPKSYR